MPELPKELRWNVDLINRYVNSGGFTAQFEIDTVLKELRTKQIIEGVLDTTIGKVMMSSIVDGIAKDMGAIIGLSIDGFDKNMDEIRQKSLQIGVSCDFLINLRTLLSRGEEHEKKMNQINEKTGGM
jgi:hypothetical protein